jgi:hypothetical protein
VQVTRHREHGRCNDGDGVAVVGFGRPSHALKRVISYDVRAKSEARAAAPVPQRILPPTGHALLQRARTVAARDSAQVGNARLCTQRVHADSLAQDVRWHLNALARPDPRIGHIVVTEPHLAELGASAEALSATCSVASATYVQPPDKQGAKFTPHGVEAHTPGLASPMPPAPPMPPVPPIPPVPLLPPGDSGIASIPRVDAAPLCAEESSPVSAPPGAASRWINEPSFWLPSTDPPHAAAATIATLAEVHAMRGTRPFIQTITSYHSMTLR